MTPVIIPVDLQDWRCEGTYLGRICGRVIDAYDPTQTTLTDLKKIQQIKCARCGHLNGIPSAVGRRVTRR